MPDISIKKDIPMPFQNAASMSNRMIAPLVRVISVISGSALLLMMVLVACDVILRFFNRPISGAYELVEYAMAITVSFGVTLCAHHQGHIAVDIVTDLLSRSVRQVLACLMTLVAIAYTLPMMWMTARQIQETFSSGLTSAVLHIVVYPFTAVVALSFLVTAVVFLINLLNILAEMEKRWTR